MDLVKKAQAIRKQIFTMACQCGGAHIAGSFSLVEILVVLYYSVLHVSAQQVSDPNRDRLILSKGHCALAVYPILADLGFFPKAHLDTYGQSATILGGHPDMHKIPGIESSTGSLGHGLSFGVGVALAGKLDHKPYHVFVILGDGECQEGSIWEAAMFASQKKLDNLTVIIDNNKLQAMATLESIVDLEPFAYKWRAFGWQVLEVNGHDVQALEDACAVKCLDKPRVIIAHTIKGKGLSFMENKPLWHYRRPTAQEIAQAEQEL